MTLGTKGSKKLYCLVSKLGCKEDMLAKQTFEKC